MPNMILPDEGIGDLLSYLLREPIAGVVPLQAFLWTANVFPTHATVIGDLAEAAFDGYERKTLARSDWSVPVVRNGCATSTYRSPPLGWTVVTPSTATVYGWGAIDPSTSKLRFVQRFETADIGDLLTVPVIRLQPVITLTSAACAGTSAVKRSVPKRSGKR